MMISLYALCLGFLLDLIFGDPHWLPHPVRLMGRAISGLEKALRPRFPDTPRGRRSSGRVMVILVFLLRPLWSFSSCASGFLPFYAWRWRR